MEQNHLSHHGIKGLRWGVRRFQFKDGKLSIAERKFQQQEVWQI